MNEVLFYIVDAGSTKTDLAIVKTNSVTIKTFSGFNPNNSELSVLNELIIAIEENKKIYFYGSGLSSHQNQQLLIQQFSKNSINVYSDVLGAARALFANNSGLFSIMGTGGVVAFYDGKKNVETKGGYGYLIDDIGGGFELSKRVVSSWLNNDFNNETSNSIKTYFGFDTHQFVSWFYQEKDIQKLSKLCGLLPEILHQDKQLKQLVINYFDCFIKQHILSLAKKYNLYEISSVGSIAYYFKDLFQIALHNNNLTINNIESKPILKLIEFHKLEK